VWNDARVVGREVIAAGRDEDANRTILNSLDSHTSPRGYIHEENLTAQQADLFLQDKIRLINSTTRSLEHHIETLPALIGVQPTLPGLEGAVNRMTRLFERVARKSTKAAQRSTRR